MESVIEFNNVSKKFKKGEKFNSLRDTIPRMFKKVFGKSDVKNDELDSQEFWAVKDVSFKVGKGEVVGVIGPNGAGKSTILKMLAGIIIPNEGASSVKGRLSALIEVTAGFHPELTGRENIYLNGTILGMKRKELDEKIEEIIDFSGIREFVDTPIKRYSSGMLSRLGFSVAAHVDPDVLLVDEVLAVGDISFQSRCAEKMRELLNSGVTILIVSHNIALIQNLCSRVILFSKGEIIKEGKCSEVIPYYENLVFMQREGELKKKLESGSYKVKVEQKTDVDIESVQLIGKDGQEKESFYVDEEFSVAMEYNAKQKIPDPVFVLGIVRADGVMCCSSSTKTNGIDIKEIEGKARIKVSFGKLNLAPGIYAVRVGVWDRDMIHPYVVRKEDVFRIEVDDPKKNTEAVFFHDMAWELGK